MPRPPRVVTVKGSAVRGEEKYKVCQTCHGADGKGNQTLNAPPLVGASDWYLVSQLRSFRAGIRGGDPAKDPNGAAMRGMAATLDEQGDLDVVSYINMLSP
jgi:cytochrome c553